MITIDSIDRLLKIARTGPQIEQVVDINFDKIVDCIDQEKTADAAKMIELVFAQGAADIRLIFYYFYAHFAEHGIKSFAITFPKIIILFKEYENILLPQIKLEKHIQSSLNWFFSHLLFRMKYYEKMFASGKIHPIWKKSVLDISSEDLEQLIEVVEQIRNFFFERWPQFPTKDKVAHLLKRIENLRLMFELSKPATAIEEIAIEEHLSAENASQLNSSTNRTEEEKQIASQMPEPNQHAMEKSVEFIENDEQEDSFFNQTNQEDVPLKNDSKIRDKSDRSTSFSCSDTAIDESLLRMSVDDFLRKLQAFEALIGKNDYLKAAIVAQDIDRLIESFNPLNFFPKLFAKYFFLLAKHVPALSEQYATKEPMQVKALEKLYQNDLDMFIEW